MVFGKADGLASLQIGAIKHAKVQQLGRLRFEAEALAERLEAIDIYMPDGVFFDQEGECAPGPIGQ